MDTVYNVTFYMTICYKLHYVKQITEKDSKIHSSGNAPTEGLISSRVKTIWTNYTPFIVVISSQKQDESRTYTGKINWNRIFPQR